MPYSGGQVDASHSSRSTKGDNHDSVHGFFIIGQSAGRGPCGAIGALTWNAMPCQGFGCSPACSYPSLSSAPVGTLLYYIVLSYGLPHELIRAMLRVYVHSSRDPSTIVRLDGIPNSLVTRTIGVISSYYEILGTPSAVRLPLVYELMIKRMTRIQIVPDTWPKIPWLGSQLHQSFSLRPRKRPQPVELW